MKHITLTLSPELEIPLELSYDSEKVKTISVLPADNDEKIHEYLEHNKSITIALSVNEGIYVYDEDGGLIRELDFLDGYIKNTTPEIRIKDIMTRLIGIL